MAFPIPFDRYLHPHQRILAGQRQPSRGQGQPRVDGVLWPDGFVWCNC